MGPLCRTYGGPLYASLFRGLYGPILRLCSTINFYSWHLLRRPVAVLYIGHLFLLITFCVSDNTRAADRRFSEIGGFLSNLGPDSVEDALKRWVQGRDEKLKNRRWYKCKLSIVRSPNWWNFVFYFDSRWYHIRFDEKIYCNEYTMGYSVVENETEDCFKLVYFLLLMALNSLSSIENCTPIAEFTTNWIWKINHKVIHFWDTSAAKSLCSFSWQYTGCLI